MAILNTAYIAQRAADFQVNFPVGSKLRVYDANDVQMVEFTVQSYTFTTPNLSVTYDSDVVATHGDGVVPAEYAIMSAGTYERRVNDGDELSFSDPLIVMGGVVNITNHAIDLS